MFIQLYAALNTGCQCIESFWSALTLKRQAFVSLKFENKRKEIHCENDVKLKKKGFVNVSLKLKLKGEAFAVCVTSH